MLATTKFSRSDHHPHEQIHAKVKRKAAEGRLKRLSKEKSHTFYKEEKAKEENPHPTHTSISSSKRGQQFESEKKEISKILNEKSSSQAIKPNFVQPVIVEKEKPAPVKAEAIPETPKNENLNQMKSAPLSKPILVSAKQGLFAEL